MKFCEPTICNCGEGLVERSLQKRSCRKVLEERKSCERTELWKDSIAKSSLWKGGIAEGLNYGRELLQNQACGMGFQSTFKAKEENFRSARFYFPSILVPYHIRAYRKMIKRWG